MKMIEINRHSSKLKDWSVEMPNAPYLNRYAQFENLRYKNEIKFQDNLMGYQLKKFQVFTEIPFK